jgi:hypothetical protein
MIKLYNKTRKDNHMPANLTAAAAATVMLSQPDRVTTVIEDALASVSSPQMADEH